MIRILCAVLFAALASAGETVRKPEVSAEVERQFREALRQNLRKTRLGIISLEKVEIREAVELLVSRMRRIGTTFNLVMKLGDAGIKVDRPEPVKAPNVPDLNAQPAPPFTPPRAKTMHITWQAKNPTAEAVLDEICRQGKMRWGFTTLGIEITPFP